MENCGELEKLQGIIVWFSIEREKEDEEMYLKRKNRIKMKLEDGNDYLKKHITIIICKYLFNLEEDDYNYNYYKHIWCNVQF